jgi:hypothetical protein
MTRRAFAILLAALCHAVPLAAQSVTLGGSLNVASAEDFATRAFQDPWDMNERTDFGWFLHGTDLPSPDLTNISFANGIFSATTGTSPNVFLLETGNPFAARLGKIGTNHPIDANTYRLLAIRLNISGASQAILGWNRDHLWDNTGSSSNIFNLTPGWRTYLINVPALGLRTGSTSWGGLLRSLQFYPSYQTAHNLQIDWIRLVSINSALCRQVTWSGLGGGGVDLYLDTDGNAGNGNESLLASGVSSNTASAGCSASGSGYNFYAGGLAPGSYRVLARPAGSGGAFTQSGSAYQVNAAPTLVITSPSEEGSSDDFATSQLGNAWDMDALSDVDQFFNVTDQAITTIGTETPAGVPLGNTRVLWGRSTAAQPPLVGDPVMAVLWQRGVATRIDPTRYRILTVEFGMPNAPRSLVGGSVARIVWRVAGSTDSVSDDIIFNTRAGANVMDKINLDMADRSVLPIEEGSQAGWVPGNDPQPGIDRFRFDAHEFSDPVHFFVRRIKLAALERVSPGATYTIRWTASEGNGTTTLYYDTDRNPLNGRTQIGTAPTSAGSFVWTAPSVAQNEYFIYAEIDDGQGNVNGAYSRWPMLIGQGPPTTAPPNLRIIY